LQEVPHSHSLKESPPNSKIFVIGLINQIKIELLEVKCMLRHAITDHKDEKRLEMSRKKWLVEDPHSDPTFQHVVN
jgi:hypothetical protein